MKRAILLALLASLSIVDAAVAASEKEFAIAINIAGRQRMLSQKMAKEFLLAKLGVNPAENEAAMKETIDLFDKSLLQLYKGDPNAEIPSPPNDQIARQLGQVQLLWGNYRRALQSQKDSSVRDIATLGDPILREADKAVKMYEFASEQAGIKGLGAVVNVAGRQRMLSQKMAKEILLIALDANKDENLDNLRQTHDLFEKSHKGLVKGDRDLGLPPTTQKEIKDQMTVIQGKWAGYSAVVSHTLSTRSANLDTATKVHEASKTILAEIAKAVAMYQDLAGKKKKAKVS